MRDARRPRRNRSDRAAPQRDSSSRAGKLSRGRLLRHRFRNRTARWCTAPSDDLQRPVPFLDHRGPVVHPIAVVYVQNVSDPPMIRAMNVPADNTVGFVIARGCEHRSIAEVGEELDSLACGLAEIVRQRTRFVAAMLVLPIVPVMDPLRARICAGSDHGQQAIEIERTIELMPMDHKHFETAGCGVNQRTHGRDAPEQFLNEADLTFVMISRQEYYVGATPAPSHDFVDQLLLHGTPVPRRTAVPSVDDVADEIEGLRNMTAQEVEQRACLARSSSEVHIGDPDRSVIVALKHGLPSPPRLLRIDSTTSITSASLQRSTENPT